MDSKILQEPRMLIEGRQLKPYIVGDSAYSLLQQVLKPYNVRRLNEGDKNDFEECVGCGRFNIENAFGILKDRWTILKVLNYDVKHLGQLQFHVVCYTIFADCIMIEYW